MRIGRFAEFLETQGVDAYLVTREPNILYYARTISEGVLIVSPDLNPVLLAPKLNLFIAQDQARGCDVRPYTREDRLEQLTEILDNVKPTSIGFDELSLRDYQELQEKLNGVELVEKPELVWGMRKVKDEEEQGLMKQAGELSDIGMEAVRECLRDGIREYEVAAEAAYAMRKEGAVDIAFPFIVASGPRSAYPHAGVSERKIRKGDFVTIDIGATCNGYLSDNTRTFVIGSPSERQRSVYETVLE
ncbi:MAG: aminopeptidase P family protein, partial [Candidatus Bathyarchaeota archaeon]